MVASRWLLLGFGLLAACAAASEDVGETEDGLTASATEGRWRLPADVKAEGAEVRLTYDDAPAFSTKNCSGNLTGGARELGTFLREHFEFVSSVGGYACRRNTANRSKLSVHGTGRALDVFIPRVRGAANNGQGDKLANYLVANATAIGVQLVIWDRSIWRANGTNDGEYGGPHPHDDHIHVELTVEASKKETPWFDLSDAERADGGVFDDDDDDTVRRDAGADARAEASRPDAAKPDAAKPPVDDDDDDDDDDDVPDASAKDAGTKPKTEEAPLPVVESREDSDDDEPGEEDSLGTGVRKPAEKVESSGCSMGPRDAGSALPLLGLGLGLVLASRRRRR